MTLPEAFTSVPEWILDFFFNFLFFLLFFNLSVIYFSVLSVSLWSVLLSTCMDASFDIPLALSN